MNVKKYFPYIKDFVRRADMVLLGLGIACSLYGIIAIASATKSYSNSAQYVIVQVLALFIGIGIFVVITLIDVEIMAERWMALAVFNVLFMSTLIFFEIGRASCRERV